MLTVDPQTPLDAGEIAAIADYSAQSPSPRAACIDVMKHVQRSRRYISDEVLKEIATLLGMSTAELDEAATFYSLIFRKPVGEKVIFVCDSISCWMLGGDAITLGIKQSLGIGFGETTLDGRFTLLPTVCLGHCDHAPAMMIGERLLGDVEVAAVPEILQRAAAGRA